jgi:hypothetical protein
VKKEAFLSLVSATLLLILLLPTPFCAADDNAVETWILLVAGYGGNPLQGGDPWQFLYNSYLAYYVFRYHYGFSQSHIQYYSAFYPDYDDPIQGLTNGTSSLNNVRNAITVWLKNNADGDDNIFIYFTCHGGGAFADGTLAGGRIDLNGDEGQEHYNGTWFGVDEGLWIYGTRDAPEIYWDDDLANDLSNLAYGKLVVMFQSCRDVNSTEQRSCFSGGFIDDLSAPNRIIITSANETYYSWTGVDLSPDKFSPFSGRFFEALLGCDAYIDNDYHLQIDPSTPVNADYDANMHVSIEEAFRYAYEHDYARLAVRTQNGTVSDPLNAPYVDESPWIDDDGDGLPTFKQGQDFLDYSQSTLTFLGWVLGDANCDGIVNGKDASSLGLAWGSKRGDSNYNAYNAYCDFDGDGVIGGIDAAIVGLNWGRILIVD